MKLETKYNLQVRKCMVKKIITSGLTVGLLFNSILPSFASTLSEDGRYEAFEGDNIKIEDILEEDTVDVEVEGNTLVNIHKKQKYSFDTQDIDYGKYEEIESENSIKVTFNEQMAGWKYLRLGNLNLDLIKPNTTYTIYFEKAIGLKWIAFCQGNYLGHIGNVNRVEVVNNKAVITTSNFSKEEVSSDILLYGYTNAEVSTTTEVSNAMIFEGNLLENELPSEYFEGIMSVGEDKKNGYSIDIVSQNKNLLPYNNILIQAKTEITWYDVKGNRGVYGSNLENKTDTWIYLKEGYYKIGGTFINCGYQIIDTNENIVYLNGTNLIPEGKYCVRLKNNNTADDFGFENAFIYESDIDKEFAYIQYRDNIISISIDEPLRAISDEVKDRIIKKMVDGM